jgi:IclR family pca regulon transcriptional regulator
MKEVPRISEKDYLKTLAKGLEVIKSFEGTTFMTLSQVAAVTQLSRATVRRHLHTLRALGYVESVRDQFRLTPKILEIGHTFLGSLKFTTVLTPYMNELSQRLTRPCSAAILDGSEIVYVQHLGRAEFISINLTVGSRLPAYATSIGQILLAHLPDDELDQFLANEQFPRLTTHTLCDEKELRKAIRKAGKDGYAVVDQQMELGLRSIAVPVYGRNGRAVCGISVSRFNEDISIKESTERYLPAMLEVSAKIGNVLSSVTSELSH